MIAVSNTTPLRYLIAIGQEELLGHLFETVYVPRGVHEELTDPKTPEMVRQWMTMPHSWLEVRAATTLPAASLADLHRGEREVILLAETLKPLMYPATSARSSTPSVPEKRNIPIQRDQPSGPLID